MVNFKNYKEKDANIHSIFDEKDILINILKGFYKDTCKKVGKQENEKVHSMFDFQKKLNSEKKIETN